MSGLILLVAAVLLYIERKRAIYDATRIWPEDDRENMEHDPWPKWNTALLAAFLLTTQ